VQMPRCYLSWFTNNFIQTLSLFTRQIHYHRRCVA
jgi:hypothetical protein